MNQAPPHVTPPSRHEELEPFAPLTTRRLPFVVHALAACTFLMLTTEFVVAELLLEISADLGVSVARTGLLITVFAAGMVVGAPTMALLTRRMQRRNVLVLALAVFAVGHVVVALGDSFALLLAARFVTAWATGAFWAVAFVVAGTAAGPGNSSRALGVVGAGGMLANVVGVPLGAVAGQITGWRGPFWALAGLAVAAVVLIARNVPTESATRQVTTIRSELAALRSGPLWLALAACATTTGGVFAAYSYIVPLLTDRAGISTDLVPLVLVGFGVGTLAGSLLGGRIGDARPRLVMVGVPTVTTAALAALAVVSTNGTLTVVVVFLVGLIGLSANPVLTALAVRYSTTAPTLGSSLSVAAFNVGTAIGTSLASRALDTGLGTAGPAAVGAGIVLLTLIPTCTLAARSRRSADAGPAAARTGRHVAVA